MHFPLVEGSVCASYDWFQEQKTEPVAEPTIQITTFDSQREFRIIGASFKLTNIKKGIKANYNISDCSPF